MKKLNDFLSCSINDQQESKVSGGKFWPTLYITVLGTTESGPGKDRPREDDEISIGYDWC
jgi:hypothetical protein